MCGCQKKNHVLSECVSEIDYQIRVYLLAKVQAIIQYKTQLKYYYLTSVWNIFIMEIYIIETKIYL